MCSRPEAMAEAFKKLSPQAQGFLQRHTEDIAKLQELKAADLLTPFRQLCVDNPKFTVPLWSNLFPVAWQQLAAGDQEALTQNLVQLLTMGFHHKQYVRYPNVIQVRFPGPGAGVYPDPGYLPVHHGPQGKRGETGGNGGTAGANGGQTGGNGGKRGGGARGNTGKCRRTTGPDRSGCSTGCTIRIFAGDIP